MTRIYGCWLYGALTIVLLYAAAIHYGNSLAAALAVVSAGAAYEAEYVAVAIEMGRWQGAHFSQQIFVALSVALGVASFVLTFFIGGQ